MNRIYNSDCFKSSEEMFNRIHCIYKIILVFVVLIIIFLSTRPVEVLKAVQIQSDDDPIFYPKYSNNKLFYSKWPKFNISLTKELSPFECINNFHDKKSFEYLKEILNKWSLSDDANQLCQSLYKSFDTIYDIQYKSTNVRFPPQVFLRIQKKLGDKNPFKHASHEQKITIIYNRFTNEECYYNLLRGNRPKSFPDLTPKHQYEITINESKGKCDFCKPKNFTSNSNIGIMDTDKTIVVSNLFPFNKYHELILPRKHSFLEVTYSEFRETLNLVWKWHQKVYEIDSNYMYPTSMWDFMYRGGASQMHPHIHVTSNEKRFYSNFEAIRRAAEVYYKKSGLNYFNEYIRIHHQLDLTYKHKDALLIVPLTARKEFDVEIISDSYNESVTELLYSVLRTYFEDLKQIPFSLCIYYPQLDETDNGRIPLYIRIFPRGHISEPQSDTGFLELLTSFNTNEDQYAVIKIFRDSLKERLKNINN